MTAIKRWIGTHPNLWQFILFNILSNCATITNFVVMNNTANALLALGASPVMAHAPEEVAEMAAMASAVVLNMGTLSERWVEAMLLAGQSALEHNVPIVFDPVGVGATNYRNRTARRIFKQFTPSIIRGNASEIMALAAELFDTQQQIKTKGVDSTTASDNAIETAQTLAQQLGTVIAISGAEDFITDGKSVHSLKNGSPMMARVTGMGCTASAITGAFAGVNSDMLEAAAHAMAVMGIAGELATLQSKGPGSLQVNFLDQLYTLTPESIVNTLKQ